MSNIPNNQDPEEPSDNESGSSEGTSPLSTGNSGTIQPTLPTVPLDNPIDADQATLDLSAQAAGGQPEGSDDDAYDFDDSKTVQYDAESKGSGPLSSVGSSQGGSGGSGKVSGGPSNVTGSDERLRREWAAAIGSSGKGSGESIRLDVQEASDSVLERIALRTVADPSIDRSEHAKYDYVILDKIGKGGMGVVYSAQQNTVNRVVALKTLREDKADDASAQKQFFYEAEVTADLDHPNIVPIYELGSTADGRYFYTMKRIRGSEWHGVMGKRSLEQNLEIFEKLADAIGFAHSKSIVHLDIKPQNVIVGGYGEVYVMDWGMAHDLSKKTNPPSGGTLDYMAPEQARRAFDKIGTHTDIYLLGAALFQVLTGKTPHAGADTKDKKKLVFSKLQDATHNKIRPTDSDSPLLQVALKAMSTEPADRYATVEDMQGAVREIVRENANIKTSLELTQSSKTTLQLAEKSQDYERFNRAIFGFRNAVEVWTGNKDAEEQLAKARLAFGQCAFAKGDFDLALQTLDRKVPEEATLFDKAQKAKTAVLNRESRFKTLRNAVFGLLAIGALGATGAALGFNYLRNEAIIQKVKAEDAQKAEAEQKKIAVQKQKEAEDAQKAEAEQKKIAVQKQKEAEDAQKAEADQKKIAVQKQKEAEDAQKAEADQKKIAVQKQKEAEDAQKEALARLAQVTVGDQLTNLGLASAQADKANPLDARSVLQKLSLDPGAQSAFGLQAPQIINWASRRVELLSNKDVKPVELAKEGQQVTAIDFAEGKNVGVVGLSDGRVIKLELRDGKLTEGLSKKVPENKTVVAAAISPNADEALLAVADNATGTGAKLYRWGLAGEVEPMQETATMNRFFQGFAYSPTGSHVIAGIRGGLWIKKQGADWVNLTSGVRGELLDADWLDERSLLVLSRESVSDDRFLYFITVPETDASKAEAKVVEQPKTLGKTNKLIQIGVLGTDKLIVATETGELATYDFDSSTKKLGQGQSLPRVHGRMVTHIDINATRERMVTGSDEAVVRAWKLNPATREIVYDTFLTGAPGETSKENTIRKTVLIDGRNVVNVDNDGAAVALDIERQKQRRELTPEQSPAKVVGIHPRGNSSSAISVDANGVVSQWNLVTGKTETAMRFSYFGHTPGATLFDTAVDAQKGLVITSAALPRSDTVNPYIGTRDNVEFCVWDQKSGNMTQRWATQIDEPAEPRLTLLGNNALYVGSDDQTVVFDYAGNRRLADRDTENKIGATFAVVNPVRPNLVGMPGRDGGKGRLWLWNRDASESAESKDLLLQDHMPVHAAWSADGERLYVLDTTGKITPFSLSGNKLVQAKGRAAIAQLTNPQDPEASAILNVLRSYQDVDLVIQSLGAGDKVICNVRQRSTDSTTTFTCNYSADGQASPTARESSKGLRWLEDLPNYNVTPERLILSKRRSGNQMFVSFKNGRVYGLSERGDKPVLYGRQNFVMSTADREGNRVMLLHQDGSLQVANMEDGSYPKLAGYRLELGEDRISLSPDGQELAVYNSSQTSVRILDAVSGALRRNFTDISEFEWDPEQGHGLATLASNGSLKIEDQDLPDDLSAQELATKLKLEGRKPVRLTFFQERWSDENQKPLRYLVVQAENDVDGKLFFVSREPAPVAEDRIFVTEPIEKGVALTASPTDSIIATGNATGTIGIRFASPKYKIFRSVYNLDRVEATSVERIAFSGDGDTLITADDKQRVSAWMSKDKLVSGQ